jgi:hypothetical protein
MGGGGGDQLCPPPADPPTPLPKWGDCPTPPIPVALLGLPHPARTNQPLPRARHWAKAARSQGGAELGDSGAAGDQRRQTVRGQDVGCCWRLRSATGTPTTRDTEIWGCRPGLCWGRPKGLVIEVPAEIVEA